jgi:hypothetical protein
MAEFGESMAILDLIGGAEDRHATAKCGYSLSGPSAVK